MGPAQVLDVDAAHPIGIGTEVFDQVGVGSAAVEGVDREGPLSSRRLRAPATADW
jgi:hypothetical protein